ncbi:unnamed protein product [Rhizophagus irregularis]|nr:unnamed protein product [Rhizophagus irregularis]
MTNTYPFPDGGKNVDIIEPFSAIQDSPLSHSSGTSALSNIMSERFILTSPIMRREWRGDMLKQTGMRFNGPKVIEEKKR